MKKLSFITQFKIEFLLPFTSCRSMLGKMPGCDKIIFTFKFKFGEMFVPYSNSLRST